MVIYHYRSPSKYQVNLDIRKNSFSRCVIVSSNNLPGEVVNEVTIKDFKNCLDIINCDSMYSETSLSNHLCKKANSL